MGKSTYTANKGTNNLLKVNDTFSTHEQHMQRKKEEKPLFKVHTKTCSTQTET